MLDREDSNKDLDDKSKPKPKVPIIGLSNVGIIFIDVETLTIRLEAYKL